MNIGDQVIILSSDSYFHGQLGQIVKIVNTRRNGLWYQVDLGEEEYPNVPFRRYELKHFPPRSN